MATMTIMTTIKDIQLKGDRVLVRQLKDAEKVGRFYIPTSVIERKTKRRADSWKGVVVTLGDLVRFEDNHYKFEKGDTVFCAPVSLDCPCFVEGEDKYLIILQEDILAREDK